MENPSENSPKNGHSSDEDNDDQYPKFEPIEKFPDPVQNQRRKDRLLFKKPLEVIPEKPSIISAKIIPSMGTRIDLQHVPSLLYVEGQPRPKYIVPKTRKQREFIEKNRAYTYKRFCKYRTAKMVDPITSKKVTTKFEVPSPEPSSAKVAPRKVSPTASWLYPDPQTDEELALKKPKSGIIINETQQKDSSYDYDSFDLVFSRKPRPER